MERAIAETHRRREIQIAYNTEHGITPATIQKKISDISQQMESAHDRAVNINLAVDAELFANNPRELIRIKESEMNDAVAELDFETAAILRDEIIKIREKLGEIKPKKRAKRKF